MKPAVLFSMLFIVGSIMVILGAAMKVMHYMGAGQVLMFGLLFEVISIVWLGVFFVKRMKTRNK